jgi:flagellar biosynthesis/type III secretory pathway M-ring protein FliF/YscJ
MTKTKVTFIFTAIFIATAFISCAGQAQQAQGKSAEVVQQEQSSAMLSSNMDKSSSVYEERMTIAIAGFSQELILRRAWENELARSIETIPEVEQARVHISIRNNAYEPTASIVLRIRQDNSLLDKQVRGIRLLVASAVEGLELSKVSVLDDSGKLLSRSIGFKEAMELRLERDIMRMLDMSLGSNKARVKISAEIPADSNSIENLAVFVLLDGIYELDSVSGQKVYKPRSEEEIALLTKAVKNMLPQERKQNYSVCVAKSLKAEEFANASMENICNATIGEKQ